MVRDALAVDDLKKLVHWNLALGGVVASRPSNAHASTRLAFEFLLLTAARSGEVRQMAWDEVDLGLGLWTVPASRMKAGRGRRVPLSTHAGEVLVEAGELRENELVFRR